MNHSADRTSAPRILCVGMPVRDLTFRVENVPARGAKIPASHFAEITGGRSGSRVWAANRR